MMKLKPCPFCGSGYSVKLCTWDDIYQTESEDPPSYAVVCDFNDDGCGATGGYRETEDEAVDAWNLRFGQS